MQGGGTMATILARKDSPGMRKCAFCKFFYDPVNEVIAPKRGQKDMWEFATRVKKPCTQKANREVESQSICPKYECKL